MSIIVQSLIDAASSLPPSYECVHRYSVPNTGDVWFVCTDGNLYFPRYTLSKLCSPYISGLLDYPNIDVPGTVRSMSLLLAWIESGGKNGHYGDGSFLLAAQFGLYLYCEQVERHLMEYPHLFHEIPYLVDLCTKHKVSSVLKYITPIQMDNLTTLAGHACSATRAKSE